MTLASSNDFLVHETRRSRASRVAPSVRCAFDRLWRILRGARELDTSSSVRRGGVGRGWICGAGRAKPRASSTERIVSMSDLHERMRHP